MVSRGVGIMPNALDTREIFYSNLLLLGFDPVSMESREKIPFSRDMFALPNKKAMEVVMYFLFSKLNPQITYEEFRGCWPVKNKVDEQKFRKTCYNWVSRLSKEESDTYFPRVVQSLFHSPGGDKFYNFLLLFSMYVLKVVMHRDHSKHVPIPAFPSKSIHNHSFTKVISKSLQVQTSLHRKRFLDHTQYSLEVQQHWKSYAMELNKENRNLRKKIRDVEKHLHREVSSKGEQLAKSIALSNDYQKEVEALQRTQHLQKVRGLWKGIEDFYSEHKPQVVDSVITNQANQHHLDATYVEVKIPDLLLREFERDIHMKRISNTYIGGKLNLISLVQLWNLSLNLMKEKIQHDSVPSFDESSPKVRNDIHTHQALLSNVESLRSTLTKETIPDLKQSIENLKSRIYQDMFKLDGPAPVPHQPSFNLSLGLLPATPPVSFTAAETPTSQRITSFQESLKRTPAGVSTPDVINAWSESLRGRIPPAQKPQLSKPSRQINDKKTTRRKKDHQPTQIPKPKNISISTARHQHKGSKVREEKIHKTLPRKGVSSVRNQGSSARKHEVISPLALDQRTKVIRTEPRKAIHKGDTRTNIGKASATANVANQIIGALSLDKPDSGSSSQSSRSSTPKLQAVDDPLKALDETVFVSNDLITRTPGPKRNYNDCTVVNGVQELDEDRESPSKSQQQSPHTSTLTGSGGLFETILNQVREPPSAKTIRTVLFSSPEEQDHHQYDLNFTDDHSPQERSSSKINSHQNQTLLPPFAFETPKVYEEDDKLKQDGVNLLTPFSFVTPLSHSSSSIGGGENGLTPLSNQERGPNTEPRGTPKVDTLIDFIPAPYEERGPNTEPGGTPMVDTLINFTPVPYKERGPNTEPWGTPMVDTLINFTPVPYEERGPNTESGGTPMVDTLISFTPVPYEERGPNTEPGGTPKVDTLINFIPAPYEERGPNTEARGTPKINTLIQLTPVTSGVGKTRNDHDLDTSFNLSRTMSETLSLSRENNPTRTPGPDILSSPFGNTRTTSDGEDRRSNSSLGPQIDLSEPTVVNESLNDEPSTENSEPKRSPFGAPDISDDEGEGQDLSDTAFQPSVSTTQDSPPSFKEMKESDLMSRLKKIKEAQSYDFTYLSPGVTTTISHHPETGMPGEKELPSDLVVSMETIQAKRLDLIQEAQRGQQVTPGADTQVNLEPYRGTEGALLTPLSTSSRGSPDNLGSEKSPKNSLEENMEYDSSSPNTMLSERFLQESPKKHYNFTLNLDFPGSPDMDPNKIMASHGLLSPEETHSRGTSEKGLNGRGTTSLGVQTGPSSSLHLWDTGPSPLSRSLRNDDRMFWLTSNGATPKGLALSNDTRLSYENFLNESMDASFLVQGTPYHDIQSSHGALRTPIHDHANESPDNSVAIGTATSPAVAQLIEF